MLEVCHVRACVAFFFSHSLFSALPAVRRFQHRQACLRGIERGGHKDRTENAHVSKGRERGTLHPPKAAKKPR